MSIRWKLFFSILVFSVAPLAIVALLTQDGVTRLGRSLYAIVREELVQVAGEEFARLARDQGELFQARRLALELSLDMIAQASAGLPAESGPTAQRFFARDFVSPATAPADAKAIPRYAPLAPNPGQGLVSVSHGTFWTPAGELGSPEAEARARRLAALRPLFQAFVRREPGLAYRFLASDGQALVYWFPGQAALPGLDPAAQPWLRAALHGEGRSIWTFPSFDPAAGRATLAVSRQIPGDGGAVCLEVLLEDALAGLSPSSRWSSSVRAMVVTPARKSGGELGLRVLAASVLPGRQGRWADVGGEAWLETSDAEMMRGFVACLKAREPGYMILELGSEELLCAFAPLLPGLSLVCLMPTSATHALPERVGALMAGLASRQMFFIEAAAAAVLVLCGLFALYWSRVGTRFLVAATRAFHRLSQGDFSVRLDLETRDERGVLVRAFNAMVAQLKERLRLRHDMDLAGEVQRSLLPKVWPTPERWELAGSIVFCDETGGDFVDVFELESGDGPPGLVVAVGDISGHGLPAALWMATARAELRALFVGGQSLDLGARAQLLNRLLWRDLGGTGQFMTLFVLELGPEPGFARWVRAGHDPATVYHPGADSFSELGGGGMLMGVVDEAPYHCFQQRLDEPGTIVAIGTDGLWETENAEGEFFGKERFRESLRRWGRESAQTILERTLAEATEFRGQARQADDVTLVVLKRR